MKWIKFSAMAAIVAFCLMFSSFASAQKAEKPEECPEGKIAISSGISTGTYFKCVNTIVDLDNALMCHYKGSTGGFENLDLLCNRVVDAALVQDDVMDYQARNNPMIKKKLRTLAPLFGSSAHLIVKTEGFKEKTGGMFSSGKTVIIKTLGDCKGRPIAAFASGVPTATIINERTGLQMQIYEAKSDAEGLKWVKEGKVAMFIAMGGMPIGWLAKEGSDITLANVEDVYMKMMGLPYYAHKLSYKNLGVYGITAITARNSLIVFDYRGPKAEQLMRIKDLLRENLEAIKESKKSHPAWQDVEDIDADPHWEKYNPPASAMSTPRRAPETPKAEMPEKPTPAKKRGR